MAVPPLATFSLFVATATATENSITPSFFELTSAIRAEQEPPLDLGLFLLELPGSLVELAFVPLLPVVLAFEKWRVHERVFDLLTNDERTMAFLPLVDVFSSAGPGFGAAFVRNTPLGSPDRIILTGLARQNGDHRLSLAYSTRIPFLSGRPLTLSARYSDSRAESYYGIGTARNSAPERLLRSQSADATVGLTLISPATPEWNAVIKGGYRRRDLSNGSGTEPGLLDDGLYAAPPGFGAPRDYPEIELTLRYDSRDSLSRPTRGLVSSLALSYTLDVNTGETGGLRTSFSVSKLVSLAPLNRVLYLALGGAMAFPMGDEVTVPLHQLIHLGGNEILRGYDDDRFVERLGLWSTAEYRFRLYDATDSGNGLSAALFFDLGKVGRDPEDFLHGPLPWSAGLGLRFETNIIMLGRLQFAFSAEGFQFSLGIGELP